MDTDKKTSSKKKSKKKVVAKKPTDIEPTKGVIVTKSVRQLVEGTDTLVKISIFTPGYEPKAYDIVVPDIIHTLPLGMRKPDDIIPYTMSGLKKKFGLRVKLK